MIKQIAISALLAISILYPIELYAQVGVNQTPPYPTYRILIINISNYGDSEITPIPELSTRDIQEIFERDGGYESVRSLQDRQATRRAIIDFIGEEVKKLKQDDCLVIYFRGYANKENQDSYLVPYDSDEGDIGFNGIRDSELDTLLRPLQESNVKSIIILDCYQYDPNNAPTFEQIETSRGRSLILITHVERDAGEFIINALRNDRDGDRHIVVSEVHDSIRERIQSAGQVRLHGENNLVLMELVSTLKISVNERATILLDGIDEGMIDQTRPRTLSLNLLLRRKPERSSMDLCQTGFSMKMMFSLSWNLQSGLLIINPTTLGITRFSLRLLVIIFSIRSVLSQHLTPLITTELKPRMNEEDDNYRQFKCEVRREKCEPCLSSSPSANWYLCPLRMGRMRNRLSGLF